ncbi:hypothetical protein KOAAANKH_02668 [Brevundimonas sp. NIBR10]|uniref:glycoside hydrolase family protein n=1 Tax=Brevundimonas sp. NIBR10 TaxID=3015997 RepID=UPI0022F19739|nr:glycoside hydrolase family protein [Brevundimonas sp. NIBR10]WGM47783.1 hypothetical protein KOAAANKH_02668 [Brevundimonas sp. NIBR10]
MQRLKISREGIILIKSFEGFRPHAVRRDDGRWVIGYGHTLSAREGGVVSEGDAELLLQYDLLPVAAALNDVPSSLNQHQFDALASFVHSIGLDRFQASDVLSRLTAGAQGEAADAIIGWADPSPADAGMRRRAAERALFVADPDRPVALAELLSAPLPPPPLSVPEISAPVSETDADANTVPAAENTIPAPASPEPEVETAVADTALIDRPASDDRPNDIETSRVEADDSAAVLETPSANDTGEVPADPTPVLDAGEGPPDDVTDDASPLDADAIAADLPEPHHPSVFDPTAQASDDFLAGADAEVAPTSLSPTGTVPGSQRYSAYAGDIVGPLPGLTAPVPGLELIKPVPVEPADTDGITEPAPIEIPTFQPSIAAAAPQAAENLLVLTPLDESAMVTTPRLVWPHDEPTSSDTPLFEDDGALRLGAHQMIRHEMIGDAPLKLEWRETGLYLVMGAFGLLSFGMSMAAFRKASQADSGSSDITIIAWVLAVIGAACVGVSAYNLYRRLGRADD